MSTFKYLFRHVLKYMTIVLILNIIFGWIGGHPFIQSVKLGLLYGFYISIMVTVKPQLNWEKRKRAMIILAGLALPLGVAASLSPLNIPLIISGRFNGVILSIPFLVFASFFNSLMMLINLMAIGALICVMIDGAMNQEARER